MGYSIDAKNGMLGQLRGRVSHVSIHTGDPGVNGANETTGGDYARQEAATADWLAAASGEVVLDADKTFSGPANSDATHFGIWDDTEFLGGGSNDGDLTFNAEGVLILKAGTKFDLNA